LLTESDYKLESQDSNLWRPSRLAPLKLKILKKDAIPTVFPNLPMYLSSSSTTPRSMAATSSSRHEQVAQRAEIEAKEFLLKDKICNSTELRQKLDRTCLPSNFHEICHSDGSVSYVAFSNTENSGLTVDYCLQLTSDLTFSMFRHGCEVPSKRISHLSDFGSQFSTCSQVLNSLAYLKAYSEESLDLAVSDTLTKCLSLLRLASEEAEDEKRPKLQFIHEQLSHFGCPKYGRRYSAQLLATAVMWENVSPTLYRQILAEDLLALPSERYLTSNYNSVISKVVKFTFNSHTYYCKRYY